MSTNGAIDKYVLVYSYNGMQGSDKEEETSATQNNMDQSQKLNTE